MICSICNNENSQLVFQSKNNEKALTSINTIITHNITVFYCKNCNHVFKNPISELDNFYTLNYKINLESADHDQFIMDINNNLVLRNCYQSEILETILNLSEHSSINIFDYGAGKGATLRYLFNKYKKLNIFLYDYDDAYQAYWQWLPESNRFINNCDFNLKVDCVCSFFVMEHVFDLNTYINNVNKLLNNNGDFIFIVPDMYSNYGDLMVADHIHHFSENSINIFLSRYGFKVLKIFKNFIPQAFVVHAKKKNDVKSLNRKINLIERINKIIFFWITYQEKLKKIDEQLVDKSVIYGAGFYGSFLYANLKNKSHISYFVDSNSKLNGLKRFGIPIVDPNDILSIEGQVLIGMNPSHIKDQLKKIDFLKNKNIKYILY
ncbi:MAG: methyltransferase domain-containing protein [Rickettsia endosymbiont of Ixodes persulcatus]|nr:methyltransferase domain-containing protein [Rickettsia endosymbiont of Ixodes persulcatus]